MIVALEGLLGAGKSTTARLLGERPDCTYAHELSAKHPFLDAFYTDVERYKLETELCFVLRNEEPRRRLAFGDSARHRLEIVNAVQPQMILDYYFPASDKQFTSFFSVSTGFIF